MVHVKDVVSANIFAMNHQDLFGGRSFDVGTGDNISLNEAKEIVNRYHQIEFDYIAPRSGEITTTRANTKPLADLGWKAQISIKSGIDECFNFSFCFPVTIGAQFNFCLALVGSPSNRGTS